MPFFRCVFIDEFGHTVFPADITADNFETAKRHALPRLRAMGAKSGRCNRIASDAAQGRDVT